MIVKINVEKKLWKKIKEKYKYIYNNDIKLSLDEYVISLILNDVNSLESN